MTRAPISTPLRASALGGLLAALVLAAGAGDPPAPPPPATPVPAVERSTLRAHKDPAAMERAVLDATLAYLREDIPAARAALDRLEEACNRLARDEGTPFPGDVIVYDQAFHMTLDVAREYAGKGRLDDSFEQFAWLQRGCRKCHAMVSKK